MTKWLRWQLKSGLVGWVFSDKTAQVEVRKWSSVVRPWGEARWPDAPFLFASTNDRILLEEEDAVIVFAAPDPPSLASVVKNTKLANEAGSYTISLFS